MNWKNPDVEFHTTGWPAVIILSFFGLSAIHAVLFLANQIIENLQ